MSNIVTTPEALITRILACPSQDHRCLVAIAGAPGSGKTTLAEDLVHRLADAGTPVQVVPMDGFHLDNTILTQRDLVGRKGAPETFDVKGFNRLITSLGTDADVYYPMFDRARDIAIAGAGYVGPECRMVLIEGNYLLLDEPDWRDLAAHWDLSIRLRVSLSDLRVRLVNRWLAHGLDLSAAQARADGNDLANASRIQDAALAADFDFRNDGR